MEGWQWSQTPTVLCKVKHIHHNSFLLVPHSTTQSQIKYPTAQTSDVKKPFGRPVIGKRFRPLTTHCAGNRRVSNNLYCLWKLVGRTESISYYNYSIIPIDLTGTWKVNYILRIYINTCVYIVILYILSMLIYFYVGTICRMITVIISQYIAAFRAVNCPCLDCFKT